MLNSAEIRWFFRGEVPASVADWFGAGLDLEVERRKDSYLVFEGSESVGVKLRDFDDPKGGKFEVKAMIGAAETLAVAANVHGRSDTWSKWSFDVKQFGSWVEAITTGEPSWMTTSKQRRLRKFGLDTDEVIEMPVAERPDNGCSAELVRLEVGPGDVWWTFGFESFGPRDRVRANLRRVLAHWFTAPAPIALDVVGSAPYPIWAANFLAYG
jgi:hypothetical protein